MDGRDTGRYSKKYPDYYPGSSSSLFTTSRQRRAMSEPAGLEVFVKIIKIFILGTVLWSYGMGPFYCSLPGKNYTNCRADFPGKKRT